MNQFDKDERMVKIKNAAIITGLVLLSFLTCHKAKAQSNSFNIDYSDTYGYKPDTTKVIFVTLREYPVYQEDKLIFYTPRVNAEYGYLIYKFGKGNEYYDESWELISQEEVLYIRKSKLNLNLKK